VFETEKILIVNVHIIFKMTSRWTKKRKVELEVQKYMKVITESSASISSNDDSVCVDELHVTGDSDVQNYAYKFDKDDASCFSHDTADCSSQGGDIHGHSDDFDACCLHKSGENVQDALLCSYAASNANDCNDYYVYSTSEFEDSDLDIPFSLDDSDSDADAKTVDDDPLKFNEWMCRWAVDNNVTHRALTSLLVGLQKKIPSLPTDARTLLRTTTSVFTRNAGGGDYCHIGIETGILSILSNRKCNSGVPIVIQINVDGLPLCKSSSSQLWPILGRIHNPTELFASPSSPNDPFVIGIYHGKSKPASMEDFLKDFVEEAKGLEICRIVHGSGCSHEFKIGAVICDMPARSMIKCVKGHGAYSGCDRCTQYGVYEQKVTYPVCDAPLRTDDDFSKMVDKNHHIQLSPLASLNLGLVSCFPLDYMHLVCLGVVRKLVSLWLTGPLKTRLGPLSRIKLNDKLVSLARFMPTEFARKPRSVTEFERWKATEYRTFLLYTGPVCLLDSLPAEMYNNFILLCVAISLLSNPSLCAEYADYTHDLLVLFVNHFGDLYGRDKITYNVHGLIHLHNDAKLYGVLDTSAFPFENYMGKLERMIRKPKSPLQQLVRRLSEVRDSQLDGCSSQSELQDSVSKANTL
jgi:hypothetical protein